MSQAPSLPLWETVRRHAEKWDALLCWHLSGPSQKHLLLISSISPSFSVFSLIICGRRCSAMQLKHTRGWKTQLSFWNVLPLSAELCIPLQSIPAAHPGSVCGSGDNKGLCGQAEGRQQSVIGSLNSLAHSSGMPNVLAKPVFFFFFASFRTNVNVHTVSKPPSTHTVCCSHYFPFYRQPFICHTHTHTHAEPDTLKTCIHFIWVS